MSIFSREAPCGECGKSIHKKKLCLYDGTHQGRIKNGQKTLNCQQCSLEKLFEQFRSLKEKLVIVAPSSSFNTYAYYGFDSLTESSRSSIHKDRDAKFINAMKDMLPPANTKCSCCSSKAHFSWCNVEIFNGYPFSWEENHKNNFKVTHLCKECLVKEFREKIQESDLTLQTIFPPLDGEGFCTPWEV